MKININRHEVIMYSSIDEMPITRYQEYNKNIMLDSGIGSDITSVDEHLSLILMYVESGDKDKAKKEVLNMRQNIAFVLDKTSPKMMAFVSLIKTINGNKIDISDPGEVIKMLSKKGLTIGIVDKFINAVKKKLN